VDRPVARRPRHPCRRAGRAAFWWPTPGIPVRSAQPSVLILDELTAFDQVYVLDSGRVVGCCDLLHVTNGTGADVSHPP
jgi:hypothetical protein